MAARYWVGGTANWDGTAGTKWAATSGGAGGESVPTAADDVYLDANSGAVTVTIAATAPCRSLNCTGFTGTLSHGAFGLNIGDGTAGAGNVALKFVSGMTYDLQSNDRGINFLSTSATQQTVDLGGKSVGYLFFQGAGSNYAIVSNIIARGTGNNINTVSLHSGTLHMDGPSDNLGLTHTLAKMDVNFANTRALYLGTATLTFGYAGSNWTWAVNPSGLSFYCGTSTLEFNSSAGSTVQQVSLSNVPYYTVKTRTRWTYLYTLGCSFVNLDCLGTASRLSYVNIGGPFTVTGELKLIGNSDLNRLYFNSNTFGAQRTITCSGATKTLENVNLGDIGFANGGASLDFSAIPGLCGDTTGNSMIGGGTLTLTAPMSCIANNSSGTSLNWTALNWTTNGTRVPLPQDDATVSVTMTSNADINIDVARLGKNIDLSGSTMNSGSTFNFNAGYPCAWYGSFTAHAGNSATFANTAIMMIARGTGSEVFTFNPGGWSWLNASSAGMQLIANNCTVKLAGNMTFTGSGGGSGGLYLNPMSGGTFDTDGYNINASRIQTNSTTTRTFNWRNSTITCSGGSSDVQFQIPYSASQTWLGSDMTYVSTNGVGYLSFGGSIKTLQLNGTSERHLYGSVTCENLVMTAGATLAGRAGGSNVTVTGTFNINGIPGTLTKLRCFDGWKLTITKASGIVSCDYLQIDNTNATGGATFYAGANSTDGGGNGVPGWIFTAPPSAANLLCSGFAS